MLVAMKFFIVITFISFCAWDLENKIFFPTATKRFDVI